MRGRGATRTLGDSWVVPFCLKGWFWSFPQGFGFTQSRQETTKVVATCRYGPLHRRRSRRWIRPQGETSQSVELGEGTTSKVRPLRALRHLCFLCVPVRSPPSYVGFLSECGKGKRRGGREPQSSQRFLKEKRFPGWKAGTTPGSLLNNEGFHLCGSP